MATNPPTSGRPMSQGPVAPSAARRANPRSWLLPTGFIVLLIVVWQLITQYTHWVQPYVLPQPWDVVKRMTQAIDAGPVGIANAVAEYCKDLLTLVR